MKNHNHWLNYWVSQKGALFWPEIGSKCTLCSVVKVMGQCCDSVVTMLWQCCNSVVTMLWQCCDMLWQCCDSVVTVLWQCPDIMSSVFGVKKSWNLFIFSSEKFLGGWVGHLIIVSLQVHDCNIPIKNQNFRVFLMTWPEPGLEFDPCQTSGRPELDLTWPWSSTILTPYSLLLTPCS